MVDYNSKGDAYEELTQEGSKVPITGCQKLLYRIVTPGGVISSSVTLMAAIVGAGILTLPFAVSLGGIMTAFLMFTFGMVVSTYSCLLLIWSAEKTGINSYQGLGYTLYGPKMGKFSEINIFVCCYGATVAHLVLMKELIPGAMNLFGVHDSVATSQFFWGIVITLVLIFPMALFKEIVALRYTSSGSLIACTYLTFVLIFEFFNMRSGETNERFAEAPYFKGTGPGILEMFPFVIFAYTCQPNILPIYKELRNKNLRNGTVFTIIGLVTIFLLYLFTGVFGYLTFYKEYGDNVGDFPAQILDAKYHQGDALVIIVRFIQAQLALSIILICAAPLLLYPCRDTLYSCFWPNQEISKLKHTICVSGLVLSSLLIALFVPGIEIVINFIGSFSNPLINFILPCIYYLKAFPGDWRRTDRLICWITTYLMAIIGVVTFALFWVGLFA